MFKLSIKIKLPILSSLLALCTGDRCSILGPETSNASRDFHYSTPE
jgi:hypothetical protein